MAFVIGLPYDGKDASLTLGSMHIPWWRVMFVFGAVPALIQVLQGCADRFCKVFFAVVQSRRL